MLLTVSKRIEFSASRRLFDRQLSILENRQRYGEESAAEFGSGRNYVAYFIFAGEVDSVTGMLINISDIKHRAGDVVDSRYDHRFLNEDNAHFRDVVPTAENIALQLLHDVAPMFANERAQLAAVHLRESPSRSATAFANGPVDANYWFEFSAARRTMSPHLNAEENAKLFGPSVNDHGHHYRARLTFDGNSLRDDVVDLVERLRERFDHKHLNRLPELRDQPVTTESLARLLLQETATASSIDRVRLHEREDFFVEARRGGEMFVGLRESFGAAHRLHVAQFSDAKNAELFGKCNNPGGHGHFYTTEATIAANYDELSGAGFDYMEMRNAMSDSIAPWRDKHLDRETEEFRQQSSTGENIVRALWDKIDNRMSGKLVRLRLWETPNNRFTLRR